MTLLSDLGYLGLYLMRYHWKIYSIVITMLLFISAFASAQSIVLDKDEERVYQELNWIPYAFFSESFGLGFGVGAAYSGWPAEAASVLGAFTLGTKGSYNVALGLSDYQMPGVPRLVLEPLVISGLYRNQRVYIGQSPAFPGERAGSNGSDQENYVDVTQWDTRVQLQLHYLLPIGDGKEDVVHKYIIDRGFLIRNPSGGDTWNPFASGRTRLSLTPEWRGQKLRDENEKELPIKTLNVEIALKYDNRDFPFNATRGSYQRVAYQRDFDDNKYFGEWEAWTFDASKLIDLGSSEWTRQRVLALGFWTAFVPTWETKKINGVRVVTKRPPYYDGATLGGIYRMRAYEDNRWQDKAAIYYSAEYRVVPEWQPLLKQEWLKWAAIQYWQWVVFAEAGQVAPHYNINDLHEKMRLDAGFGLRGMIHKALCRLDISFGEEGSRIVAMYGQPF